MVVTAGVALGRRLTLGDELVLGRGGERRGRLATISSCPGATPVLARDTSGRLTVEDLGSANGTFVNDERIDAPQTLNVGDVVRVGSTTLQLTDVGRAPAAAPARTAPLPPAPARTAPPPPAPARTAPPPPAPARTAPPAPAAPARQPPIPPAPAADRGRPATELPLGSVFAGCRVEEVIGQGDMGVVYRGEELALRRLVAIKLIRSEYSRDERFRERFRRESRIAAAIDHQNVIPIFDAGDEDGVLYIMMRLVEGTDLRAVIDTEGRLEPLRAARIVRQVGAALDAAHARAMLHRDVKPSNVLLARRDHVYLTDFGLAKPTDSVGGLTRQQTVIARAEYVAPEQVLNQRVDARADIYALGCLLFEALTGEPPFARWQGGPGPLAHVDAPPPSPLDLRPDLPPEFDEVIRRAMAKQPSERYPSAGDLGQAALVAAGGQRRANPWSVVATGEAAPISADPVVPPQPSQAPATPARETAQADRSDLLRWVVALAALAIVAAGMVGALHGISTL